MKGFYLVSVLTLAGLASRKHQHRERWIKGTEKFEKLILSDKYYLHVKKMVGKVFEKPEPIKAYCFEHKDSFYKSDDWLKWLQDGNDGIDILSQNGHYRMFFMPVEKFDSLEKVKS